MLRVLITAFGSVGDVLPFIGVGAELRKRGHDVTFIGNAYFEPQVLSAGLAFRAVGTREHFERLAADSGVFHWKTALDRVFPHFVHVVEGTYEATMSLKRPDRTLLLAGPGSLGAWIAREQVPIPLALGLVSPSRLPSRHDPPHPPRPLPAWATPLARSRRGLQLLYALFYLRGRLMPAGSAPPPRPTSNPLLDEVNRVRAHAQLPAVAGLTDFHPRPQRMICMWPEWFGKPQKDWPAGTVITGFPFYPPSKSQTATPQSPERLRARPLVFTTGSVASQQKEFFAAAVEACRVLNWPGLLVTPQEDQVPRPLPPNVTHVAQTPFAELFPRSALVVHHGGIGTIAWALAAGVPQIIKPMMGEQFDLGNRVARLGVGRMITGEALPGAQLARAIMALVRSERVAEACRRWQARVDPSTGLGKAADSIEDLAQASGLLPFSHPASQSRGPTPN